MSAHTPGPWFLIKHSNGYSIQNQEGGGGVLVMVCAENKLRPSQLADLRLHSAGPEMLEALKMAAHLIHDEIGLSGARMDYEDTKTLDAIRTAIAKAEGRS